MKPSVVKPPVFTDNRGQVYCALDELGRGAPNGDSIKRVYCVKNWSKGMIRAWHGHKAAWTGMHVVRGAVQLVAKQIDGKNDLVATCCESQPSIFWVPPGYYNGAVSLTDDTKILVFSTLTFSEVKNDDFRATVTKKDIEKYFTVVNR